MNLSEFFVVDFSMKISRRFIMSKNECMNDLCLGKGAANVSSFCKVEKVN